jgi:hypothetical protein
MALTASQVELLYVAFYNRPADPAGLAYWESSSATYGQAANYFGASPEYTAMFAGMTNTQIVAQVYENMFNRAPDPAGLIYWSNLLTAGTLTLGSIALAIAGGATGTDSTTLTNKVLAATDFTNNINTTPEILAYQGTGANAEAALWLSTVGSDSGSLTAALGSEAGVIAGLLAPTTGTTYTLTTGPDHITVGAGTVNNVNGTVNGNPTGAENAQTLSVGDVVAGNGNTVLNLAVSGTGNAALVTLSNLSKINIVSTASGTVYANAIDWTGVGSINLTAGGYLDVQVKNLEVGTGLSVGKHASGTVEAWYTNHNHDGVYNNAGPTHVASGMGSVSFIGNNVNATGSGHGTAESMGFFAHATTSNTAVTIGNVTVTGAGNNTGFNLSVTNHDLTHSGTVTVGDVSITNVADADVSIGNAAWDQAGIVSGNVSVGNVTIDVGAGATTSNVLDIYSSASGGGSGNSVSYAATAGNVSVGDITITLGASSTMAANVYAEAQAYSYSGGAALATATAGNVTVGNIDLMLGAKANLSDMAVYASATAHSNYSLPNSATVSASAGNVGVGNLTATLGASANLDLDIYSYAEAYNYSGGGSNTVIIATAGNVTVGDITATLGAKAHMSVSVDSYAHAYNSGSGSSGVVEATAGNVSVGNITASLGATAGMSVSVDSFAQAYARHGAATVSATAGNVTVGNVDLTLGAHAKMSGSSTGTGFSVYARAEATAWDPTSAAAISASAGDVSVGNITASLGDMASLDLAIYSSGYAVASGGGSLDSATAGNVTVGTVTVTAGNHASVTVAIDSQAAALIGYGVSAASATAGNVSVGDISATLGTNDHMYLNINSRAIAVNFFGSATSSTATAMAGNVTVGNVGVTVGANSNIDLLIGASGYAVAHNSNTAALASAGNVTVGNITLNEGPSAAVHAQIYDVAVAYNYGSGSTALASVGDVNVGSVTINVASGARHFDTGGGVVRNTGNIFSNPDTFFKSNPHGSGSHTDFLYVYADGNIGNVSLGNIVYTGGKSASADIRAYVYADNSGSIATYSVGNINATVGNLGHLMNTNYIATSNGNIGNVTLGKLSVTLGTGATFDRAGSNTYLYVDSADGTIGNVKLGGVSVVAATGASANITNDIYGGAIPNTSSHGNGGIASFSQGNISLNVAKNGFLSASTAISADGNIGNIKVGNVTLSAGAHSTADHYLVVEAFHAGGTGTALGNIGTTTVGNVSASAVGAGAKALERVFIASSGDGYTGSGHKVGAVNVGTISLNATAAKSHTAQAQAEYIVGYSASSTVGALTVGNISLTVNSGGHDAVTLVDAGTGTLTVGNITIKTTTALTAHNHVAVHLAGLSGGNIVIGNITVSGGNGTGDNFGSLAGMVSGSIVGSGSLTIGNIDYSGYGGNDTINLTNGAAGIHDYKGASTIIGSAHDNSITVGVGAANDGAHTITGNGAAPGIATDSYTFADNMTASTAAGTVSDTITNFNWNNDTIHVGFSPTVNIESASGVTPYASLTAFETAVGSATASTVYVGEVTSGSTTVVDIVVVDTNNHVFAIQLSGTTNIANVHVGNIVA